MDIKENMDEIDKLIYDALVQLGPMSSYKISKVTELSWATVKVHTKKLCYLDLINTSSIPWRGGPRLIHRVIIPSIDPTKIAQKGYTI